MLTSSRNWLRWCVRVDAWLEMWRGKPASPRFLLCQLKKKPKQADKKWEATSPAPGWRGHKEATPPLLQGWSVRWWEIRLLVMWRMVFIFHSCPYAHPRSLSVSLCLCLILGLSVVSLFLVWFVFFGADRGRLNRTLSDKRSPITPFHTAL